MFNYKDFYVGQIDFYEKGIEHYKKHLAYVNDSIKRIRKEDKELVEWVWSKGVVTAFEMALYTKDYKSSEMKKELADRSRSYRKIKEYKNSLAKYSKLLQEIIDKENSKESFDETDKDTEITAQESQEITAQESTFTTRNNETITARHFKVRCYKRNGDLSHEKRFAKLEDAEKYRSEWASSIGLEKEPTYKDFALYPTIWRYGVRKSDFGGYSIGYQRLIGY